MEEGQEGARDETDICLGTRNKCNTVGGISNVSKDQLLFIFRY